MSIDNDNRLRIHSVNVDHGDALILEFPDEVRNASRTAHYGVVDTGRPGQAYKTRAADYLETLIDLRGHPAVIDFVCVTHPHEDHYGGLRAILDRFASDANHLVRQFWDCGFRTVAKTYNKLMQDVAGDDRIVFVRLASGAEYEFGTVRIQVLAPSIDLRNRFDTFGVDRNNASIVLKVMYRRSAAILAGDAFFDSWGKIAEEYPRTTKITYAKDAHPDRSEGTNQLNCQLIKVSHHGSKHGTSLEYLEKLTPKHFLITCADPVWYQNNKPSWGTSWPHPLTMAAIAQTHATPEVRISRDDGNVVYTLTGSNSIAAPDTFPDVPDPLDPAFRTALEATL